MHGKEENSGLRLLFLELSRGLESVQTGHGYIQQEEIRVEVPGRHQERFSVSDRPDYFKLGQEQLADLAHECGVIIRHEYRRTFLQQIHPFRGQLAVRGLRLECFIAIPVTTTRQ